MIRYDAMQYVLDLLFDIPCKRKSLSCMTDAVMYACMHGKGGRVGSVDGGGLDWTGLDFLSVLGGWVGSRMVTRAEEVCRLLL